jgi:nucleolar pre-ribosomal-associated protein 2
LNEQIRQATHIIRLPSDWSTITDPQSRAGTIRTLVRARAEWVLRWILDKLKDEAELGVQARANPTAWKLLDWMVHVLPTSRSATHLRDAGFLTILEKTLQENFEKDGVIRPVAVTQDDDRSKRSSDSSETAQEDSKPSKKRKRPSSGVEVPSKKVALETRGLEELFGAVTTVMRSLVEKSKVYGGTEEIAYTEHMKMALRTESAQAARILKFWMSAVLNLLEVDPSTPVNTMENSLDLSLVLEIWELRTVDADDDSGASPEQFSTECLIPTLSLYNRLREISQSTTLIQDTTSTLQAATQELERLLARHLFAPSRAAFFSERQTDSSTKIREAKLLAGNLEPLRAKLLQAAQILDTLEPLPSFFIPLFQAVPLLLDLAIRFSPSRTPKTRVAEKPWIQAVFVALAECAGCPLEAPTFVVPRVSLEALEKSLHILVLHDMTIDSAILEDLFWFHAGVKFPLRGERVVHWSLIAALIELDSGLFLTKPKSGLVSSEDRPEDLTNFLFDQISNIEFADVGTADDDRMEIDTPSHQVQNKADREIILNLTILPIMSAYARNRDLLGFVRRWDTQLFENAPSERSSQTDLKANIWQERGLVKALAEKLEISLTQPQILDLFKQHASRVKSYERATKTNKENEDQDTTRKSLASTVILYGILGSLHSDEITDALDSHLLSLLKSYSAMVQDDKHRSNSPMDLYWKTLAQLLATLWPISLHRSVDLQNDLLLPIIQQASEDVAVARKSQDEHTPDSRTRTAALMFLFVACDHLRTLPSQDSLVSEGVRKALKTISATRLEITDLERVVELFCADYAHLLEHLEPEAREKALINVLHRAAELDIEAGVKIADALSEALLTFGSPALQVAYSAALLSATGEADENEGLRRIVDNAFLRIHPSTLHRDRREAILNKMTDILMSSRRNVHQLLSIMCQLMEIPNATAKISSDGNSLFELAEKLHDGGSASPLTLRLFQDLVRLTLSHILPNKDQAQNKIYLGYYEKGLAFVSKKASACSTVRIAILRGTLQAQKEDTLLNTKLYATYLKSCLADSTVSNDYVIEALNEIATVGLQTQDPGLNIAEMLLISRVITEIPSEDMECANGEVFTGDAFIPTQSTQHWIRLHTSVGRFGLYPSPKWYSRFSMRLLQEPLTDEEEKTVLRSFADAVATLDSSTELTLVEQLVQSSPMASNLTPSYHLLSVLVSALDEKHSEDATRKQQQLAILPTLCNLLSTTSNYASFNALLNSIDTILRSKPALTTQHSIESVLTVLVKITSRNSPALPVISAPAIYSRLCETSRLILLLHRGRLGGRFHLLLPLLQNLLFCLFIPNAGRGTPLPSWIKSPATLVKLTPSNAAHYTRVLSTLCSPTHFSVAKSHKQQADTKSTLNDPVKAAKEYVSHYIYPLLGSFCRFQLGGRFDPEVRQKLMPGVWEVVTVAGMDRSALDAMFAGLDKSTRDVWRGVWGEWVRVHGDKGREKGAFKKAEERE